MTAASPARLTRVLASILAALGLFIAGACTVIIGIMLAIGEPKPQPTGVLLYFSPVLAAVGCALAAIFFAGRGRLTAALVLSVMSVAAVPVYVLIFLQ